MTSKQSTKQSLKRLAFAVAMTCALVNTGCEKDEDRTIAEAKDCIDHATNSDMADTCLAKISGIENDQANLIRCSAHFVAQDFTSTRLANAFKQIKDNGSNSTATAMAYFVFAKNLPKHTVDIAYSDCDKSGVRSMTRLATMSKMATTIADVGLSGVLTNLDPTDPSFAANAQTAIQTAITHFTSNATAADKSALGTAVLQAQGSFCNSGSSFSSNDVCTKLNAATSSGSATPTQIADQLINLLKTQ